MTSPAAKFTPISDTVNIAATATTGSVALGHVSNIDANIMVCNLGTSEVFIKFGTSSVTATLAAAIPVPVNAVLYFSIGPKVTHVAAICNATETASVYFTPGHGA